MQAQSQTAHNVPSNSTSTILMIRPANFGSNPETLADNAFQQPQSHHQQQQQQQQQQQLNISKWAEKQFDNFVNKLQEEAVDVIVVQDTKDPVKPDAVFPNNWISTLGKWVHNKAEHSNQQQGYTWQNQVFIYPMKPQSRRIEKSNPVLQKLQSLNYKISSLIDLSHLQPQQKFLEGTGSMVLDHQSRLAFACKSDRTNQSLFHQFCTEYLHYQPIFFTALDENGKPYYHTNVILAICTKFVIICTEGVEISDRERVLAALRGKAKEGKEIKAVIEISRKQVQKFCGNVLEVRNKKGELLIVMGQDAYNAFTQQQKSKMLGLCDRLVPVKLETIQKYGGGGSRCMMCQIYLRKEENN